MRFNFLWILPFAISVTIPDAADIPVLDGVGPREHCCAAVSKLLLTASSSPTLYTLDPTSTNATVDEVYTFPNSTGLTGIIEYQPDVYALVASALNTTTRKAAPGTVAIWRVDLTSQTPAVTQVVVNPQITLLNGLLVVPGHPDVVLAAESVIGGDASSPGEAPWPALGINGLHVRDGALYFTNSQLTTFARIPLRFAGGLVSQAGAAQVLGGVQPTRVYDDFAFDRAGLAWVTKHPAALTLLYPLGNGTWAEETAAGDPAGNYTVFIEPTSAAFGRGSSAEEDTLYVVTAGGQVVGVNTSGAAG
ncbi:hypothetical protein DFH07DRAFT_1068294 [Mycena maculata]|uniref:SMP-30/Gluconolactonase/LRE-like region domain-containing protein n=1 Tax=Mycena maculata TaxID=230809 RepID=A0AAD7HBI5_9AGAR|nr:hypothetical protein DFH07DRAFT_1068294 [Mycena maculata]